MAKGMCWVYNKGDRDNGKYEYFDDNGIWQKNNPINKNGWLLIDGKWYYSVRASHIQDGLDLTISVKV